jgi:hypothetical protein
VRVDVGNASAAANRSAPPSREIRRRRTAMN